jgi:hypothetical protein
VFVTLAGVLLASCALVTASNFCLASFLLSLFDGHSDASTLHTAHGESTTPKGEST